MDIEFLFLYACMQTVAALIHFVVKLSSDSDASGLRMFKEM